MSVREYMARHGLAGDDVGADELGFRFPWHRRRHGGGGGARWPHPGGNGGGGGGGGGGEGGEDMDSADVGDIEGEIGELEQLGADTETVHGDSAQAHAATLGALHETEAHLRHKLAHYQHRFDMTPAWKKAKRHHWMELIKETRRHLERKEERKRHHERALAARTGSDPAMLRNVNPYRDAMAGNLSRAEGNKAFNLTGITRRSVTGGQEIRIALLDTTTGAAETIITVAAGAGLRTASIAQASPIIPYASYELLGLDVAFQAIQGQAAANTAQASEILINSYITQYGVNGGLNQIYGAAINVLQGAQYGPGQLSNTRTIAGIRKNSVIAKTNTVTLAATFRQEITTTVTITATFASAMIVDTLEDDEARGAVA